MNSKTDWDSYYNKPYKTASITRLITGYKLAGLIKKYYPEFKKGITIAELGGANSCFFDLINRKIKPKNYLIIDNNELGLNKFRQRIGNIPGVALKNVDVLNMKSQEKVNLVFSVGLIEHFSFEDTSKVIAAHFNMIDQGDICIITFPTPTWLYNITRKIAERLGVWIFFDERPIGLNEAHNEISKHGQILHKSITWSIILTQGVIVAKKM